MNKSLTPDPSPNAEGIANRSRMVGASRVRIA